MRCDGCGQDNRDGRKFCAECGSPLTVACPACGTVNEPGEKFCGECGTKLQGVKGLGGSGLRDSRSTLTPNPVTPNPLASGARKVVTIIFADLVGSTSLHERLDAEAVRQFMDGYYAAMRGAVEAHGGRVTQVMGDGVKAVFGAPRVAEDDAIRAVRAGVEMQRAFHALAEQQQGRVGTTGLRVAVNTGEVVAEEGQEIIGDPVNVAARLQERGRDGDVVIGGSTQRLVASLVTLDRLGSFALKGRAEKVEAYRVVSLEPPTGAATTVFVGRDEELARLSAVYQDAIAKPAAKLAVLVASPGLGKSRLITEFVHRLGEATTVLTAHCDAAGGASFAPLAEALRELLSENETHATHGSHPSLEAALPADTPDRARIAAGITALLAGSPASPEETFFVVRRLLAALATAKPVVLVIDDLHWAEPLLLDLVEHLVQWGSGVSLFVLVGARPELRDLRSSLVTPGGFVSDVVTLTGLDAGAATRLAANVIGAADLPAAVAVKVLATSEGNPLFVSELVRMLVQEGGLTKEGDRWTTGANLAALEMPPTIHALLAARIERLRPEESIVLERAAVVGRQFSRSAVAALFPNEVPDLDARLESLRRSELIERDAGWLLGEPVLRFHHVLIRDAAYRRLLKGTRVDLHERLAEWIGAKVGDAPEHDETIGFHLEQAHEHLRELGPLDDKGKSLGERAARHLAAAGRRALARDDVPLAASLLGRAVDCLDPGDPARADLALDWCEALLSAGDVGPAAKAIEELGRFIGGSLPFSKPVLSPVEGGGQEGFVGDEIPLSPPLRRGSGQALKKGEATFPNPQPLTPNPLEVGVSRLRAWHTCFAGQLTVMTAPEELEATTTAVAQAAEEFAQLGDDAGEAKAHSVHAQALARLGRVGACEAALDKALAAARKAGDRRRANAVLAGAPLAALWGPSPVTRASGRCLDVVRVLRITQGAPAVEAVALSCQGVLEALRGRTDAARRMIASSRKMVEELGIAHRLFEADVFAGRIDLLEGNAEGAERILRGAYDGLRELGLGIDAARAGALLARALLLQGKVDEAEKLTRESEQLAGDDLQAAIAWRGVRAEALAQRGEHAAAIELASKAVEIAAATDALLDHAGARLALATSLRSAGRAAEADLEEQRAQELWKTKGATLLAVVARVDEMPESTRPSASAQPTGVQRRVRPNAASAAMERLEAATRMRDLDAVRALHDDAMQLVDHQNGSTYGLEGVLQSFEGMLRAPQLDYRLELLATLGQSLCLGNRWVIGRGREGARLDVAEFELENAVIGEIGDDGRFRCFEVFPVGHLGDSIARFYERYAELLPAGRERDRAAAISRTVATFFGSTSDVVTALAPDAQAWDHRKVGVGVQRGAPTIVEAIRALLDLSADNAYSTDDVLDLRPDAFLIGTTNIGTSRTTGGTFERNFLALVVFDADGCINHWEAFDLESHAEAFARFDELTGSGRPASPNGRAGKTGRRVRPNAATRYAELNRAAMDAGDFDAVLALASPHSEVVHHPTHSTFSTAESVASLRPLSRAKNLARRDEALATLGDSLALMSRFVSHDGIETKHGAVGPVHIEQLAVIEVDEGGRVRRNDVFDGSHLGEAIACLYERYAETLPVGGERERCTLAARVMGLVLAAEIYIDDVAKVISSDFESVDHRPLSTWSERGGEAFLEHVRALQEVADDVTMPVVDVLALEPSAILVHRMHSGTERIGGGSYERPHLGLWVTGDDGRLERYEIFDDDCATEALARFEELTGSDRPLPGKDYQGADVEGGKPPPDPLLGGTVDFLRDSPSRRRQTSAAPQGERRESFEINTNTARAEEAALLSGRLEAPFARLSKVSGKEGEPRRRVRPNAAARTIERLDAAIAARDVDALAATYSDKMQVLYHPTGATYGKEGDVATWRKYFRAKNLVVRHTPIATLGESLALLHGAVSHDGIELKDGASVGPVEVDYVVLFEVDGDERGIRSEVFAREHLSDAIARLYQRYAELAAEGPERDRAAMVARAVRMSRGTLSEPGAVEFLAQDVECIDHRKLATWSARGRDALARQVRGLTEVASDVLLRDDDVVALDSNAVLTRRVNTGTARLGGGIYERALLSLFAFGADGRITRAEMFDADCEVEALARFDELTTAAESRRSGRSGQSNAATRWGERIRAAVAARDFGAIVDLSSPHCEVVHHPTGSTYSGAEANASHRSLLRAKNLAVREEVLATLGDSLALMNRFISYEGLETRSGSFGPVDVESVAVIEVDESGRMRHAEEFDTERLGEAIACLYERHAKLQPEGRERDRAAMTARAVRAMLTPFDLGRDFPDIEQVDHRILGSWTARGPGEIGEQVRALHEVAEDAAVRDDDVLALGPTALLVQRTHFGTERVGGGVYETPHLVLMGFGRDGLLARVEFFDVGQEAAALARFDELTAGEGSSAGAAWSSTATRTAERMQSSHDARDWEGFAARIASDLRYLDRRRMVQEEFDRTAYLGYLRSAYDMPSSHHDMQVVATRGEHLVLIRVRLEVAGGDVGPSEIPSLLLIETNARGEAVVIVRFDPDDLDAAYTEIDARWQAGEARAHPAAAKLIADWSRCFAARDWDGLARLFAPDLVSDSHRFAGWGELQGPSALVFNAQAQIELAPDTHAPVAHLRTCESGVLVQSAWRGSREGGLFDSPWVIAAELNDRGQVRRLDAWDVERTDEALARFEEIRAGGRRRLRTDIDAGAPVAASPFENAAFRVFRDAAAVWTGERPDRLVDRFAPAYRCRDRRRVVQLDLSLSEFVEFGEALKEMKSRNLVCELLGTAGESLALIRNTVEVEDGDVGASTMESVSLIEIDDQGKISLQTRFDPEDEDAAFELLTQRLLEIEDVRTPAVVRFTRGFRDALEGRDWDALARWFAPDFVGHDHRLVSWGTLRGPWAFLESLRQMVELAPDVRLRAEHMRAVQRSALSFGTWIGTRDGGAFESPYISVLEVDADGQALRIDFYDPHHLDRALARFDEIGRGEPSGHLTAAARALPDSALAAREEQGRDPFAAIAKPNAANAALERFQAAYEIAFESGDWSAVREVCAPDVVFEDRRRLALVSGGLELLVDSLRQRVATGARYERTRVGSAGNRVAVERMFWSGGAPDGRFEIEYLVVGEVDESGRLCAAILFDLDDGRAAQREAWARWARIEPEIAESLTILSGPVDAFNTKNREGMGPLLADDLVVEDRRRTGMGHLEGGDAYVDSLFALWQLAPNSQVELGWFWPVIGPQGGIFTVRRTGEIADGGDYESDYLALLIHAEGQWKRLEFFEIEDLDEALARFNELVGLEKGGGANRGAAQSSHEPFANAATRIPEQIARAWATGDWETFEAAHTALHSPTHHYDDRRPLMRIRTPVETSMEGLRVLFDVPGSRFSTTPLATRGERLALTRLAFEGQVDAGGGDLAIDFLAVGEMDEEGRTEIESVLFDPDDLEAAYAELDARFAAGEGAAHPLALAALHAGYDRLYARDWDGFAALHASEFDYRDHRLLGWGTMGRNLESFIRVLQSLFDLSSDARYRVDHVRLCARGALLQITLMGTRDGGAFETPLLDVMEVDEDGRILSRNTYDVEDYARALARFEELVGSERR